MRWSAFLCLLVASEFIHAADAPFAVDIKGTSLKELMQLKISTLSRKSENARRTAASVSVLTSDDIRRLGVTHIAEALRYIPGVEVSRLEANKWSISIRGFNSRTANKLLVMIDGRSIYSPLFSGVLWEDKDVLLEDVDRIEVVRGPGGAAWGANAVNGVINIITKHAESTQGNLVRTGAGLEDRGYLVGRSGWKSGDNAYSRLYAKSVYRDDGGTGGLDDDHGEMNQVGFRHDQNLQAGQSLTLQGDLYRHQSGPEFRNIQTLGQEDTGGNLLANWSLQNDAGFSQNALAYFDKTSLKLRGFIEHRNTWNVDYQQSLKTTMHHAVWGVGYRKTKDEIETFPADFVTPPRQGNDVKSVFFNDDIALSPEWHFIVGTKFEDNDYSDHEWQPSVRTSYLWGDTFLWAAWSKAVRTPTRLERSISTIDAPDAGVGFGPEYVTFKELGARFRFWQRLNLSVSLYHADYESLLSTERTFLDNNIYGNTEGVELAAAFQAADNWLLKASFTAMDFDLTAKAISVDDRTFRNIEGSTPDSRIVLSSLLDINKQWQLNTFLRYVDSLDALNVDAYLVGDITLSWRPHQEWEFQAVARHLGDNQHPEWGPLPGRANQFTEVEADFVLFATWRFK